MALNSFLFLLAFLPVVVAGTFVARDRRGAGAAQLLVLVASLAFYASDGIYDLALLLTSITFNWGVATRLARTDLTQPTRKRWLVGALVVDVGVLCVFKYARAVETLAGVADSAPDIGFPLGLSFFTLTQVMYLVDCYERLVPARRWFDHATFVSFFPNVTAGPLLRARRFYAQLEHLGSPLGRDERVARAATLVALGLLKKVVLGDSFAQVATAGYAGIAELSTLGAWITVLAGTFEIYFDFSGYSDMAFGCAELLGLSLVRNFDVPFRSATISEFWKRWHISLSEFITTYLYTPILRSMGRATLHKSAVATVIAMLIAGVWHGATWNYVLFGVLHGGALAGFQYWKKLKRPLARPAATALTFVFVSLTFITVRAPDLASTIAMIARLLPRPDLLGLGPFRTGLAASDLRMMALPLLFGTVAAFVGPKAEQLAARARPAVRWDAAVIGMLLLAYMFMSANAITIFRYRQF